MGNYDSPAVFTNSRQYTPGAALGKILVSDASGNESWQDADRKTWHLVREVVNSSIGSGAAAGTYVCDQGGAILNAAGGNSGFQMFRLDPTDFPAGPGGATPLIRVRVNLFCNGSAPGNTITGGLYPISTFSGASGALPQIATFGAATTSVSFATPAASSQNTNTSTPVNFPSAGWFFLGVTLTGAAAANSEEQIGVRLEVQQA